MRTTLLAALIAGTCLWPAPSQAQTSSSGGGTRGASPAIRGSSRGAVRPGPPRVPDRGNSVRPIVPPAPPSAPPIGPFASPSALDRSPSALNRDVFQARRRTYDPRYSQSQGFFYGSGGGYVTDPFGYISQPDSSAPALDRYMREGDAPEGYLRLDVQPESAQVFVDGLYAGTVADFRRSGGGRLDSGPHRIELRADGYDTQSVELRIRANDVLSYRGTLNRSDDRPELRASDTTLEAPSGECRHRRFGRLRQTRRGVVVRERDGVDSGAGRQLDQLRR